MGGTVKPKTVALNRYGQAHLKTAGLRDREIRTAPVWIRKRPRILTGWCWSDSGPEVRGRDGRRPYGQGPQRAHELGVLAVIAASGLAR